MVFVMILGAVGYVSAQGVSATAGGETMEIVTQAASSGWQPKPTRTVSSNSSFPLTLKDGDVLQINGPIDYSAPTGTSPITVVAGANAKIIINGSVTLHGANASGTTGATAAIRVPSGAKLTIYSAHDEELSTSTAAPKDTLTVIGGSAAAGSNGQDALKDTQMGPNTTFTTYWYTGAGGDGGGGAECTQAENDMDNKSAGGAGGPGVGVTAHTAVPGGLGGEEKDHQYNGGDGGAGGASLTRQAWHSAGGLVLSTAANRNTSSWGDGGGQGSMTTLVPYVVYDLMDCYVELNQTSLTYTGKQLRPTVKSVTYSVNSDRDKALVAGSGSTLTSSNYSISGYGENIHCPSGTLTLLGAQNASRTTTQTRGAVVGSIEVTFTIKRATLTGTVSLSNATPYMYETIAATLSSSYTSPTAGSGKLSSLLRESTQKAEGPVITWSLQTTEPAPVPPWMTIMRRLP